MIEAGRQGGRAAGRQGERPAQNVSLLGTG